LRVGRVDGASDGKADGTSDGPMDGVMVGRGVMVGIDVGMSVGSAVGAADVGTTVVGITLEAVAGAVATEGRRVAGGNVGAGTKSVGGVVDDDGRSDELGAADIEGLAVVACCGGRVTVG
jgi:hypothetical protein